MQGAGIIIPNPLKSFLKDFRPRIAREELTSVRTSLCGAIDSTVLRLGNKSIGVAIREMNVQPEAEVQHGWVHRFQLVSDRVVHLRKDWCLRKRSDAMQCTIQAKP
jgi:hypothetical protein